MSTATGNPTAGILIRRVRKDEYKRADVQQMDPLDECLECWKESLAGDPDRDLKAKPMGGLMGNTDGHGTDLYEKQQERNAAIAAATDAMIDSLSGIHRWAIYAMCGIATPWSYPRADLLSVGPAARDSLAEKLKRNPCTAVMF